MKVLKLAIVVFVVIIVSSCDQLDLDVSSLDESGGGAPTSSPVATDTDAAPLEKCDGMDNDGDKEIDEDGAEGSVFYFEDLDGDGFGNSSKKRKSCEKPDGYVLVDGDCDDSNQNLTNSCATDPIAKELCSTPIDDDEDGQINEENSSGCKYYYYDQDSDGYGVGSLSKCLCSGEGLYVAPYGGDCDDNDNSVLGADEFIDNVDQDCDGESYTIQLSSVQNRFMGEAQGDNAGTRVLNVGDIDNDGIDDILISAIYAENQKGKIYIKYGDSSIDISAMDAAFIGENEGDHISRNVSGAGDVNADGCDDILIGLSTFNNTQGKTYLIYGGGTGCITSSRLSGEYELSTTGVSGAGNLAGLTLLGVAEGDSSGGDVKGLGDIDGDGKSDFIIGAPDADTNEGYAGKAYLIYGKAVSDADCLQNSNNAQIKLQTIEDASDFSCGHVIRGSGRLSTMGTSMSAVGDINQNGTPDFIIGAYGFNPFGDSVTTPYQWQGKVYLFDFGLLGGSLSNQLSAESDATAYFEGYDLTGLDDWRSCGNKVSNVGDVDGDGIGDFVIGCYAHDNNTIPMPDPGAAYLFYGQSYSGDIADDAGIVFLGTEDNGQVTQEGLAAAGDVNRDGFDDFLIGGNRTNGIGFASLEAGKTYLVLGRSRADFIAGKSTADYFFLDDVSLDFREVVGFQFVGERPYDESGLSVAAGDFDGDGDSDVLIGAPGDEVNKNFVLREYSNNTNPPRPGVVYLIKSNY